jgi:hypothetical protein
VRTIVARRDPALSVRVLSRRPLVYAAGADPASDRPGHVRAASSAARVGARLAVVQGDANFVALVDPATGTAEALELPRGAGGRRQLDKPSKLDLEACATDGETLLAFGSGSTPARERIVELAGVVRVHEATGFYSMLRRDPGFCAGDLNIEGATLEGDTLRLFQRGNGPARVNATCDMSWGALLASLRSPRTAAPPRPGGVVRYDLGAIDGVALSFTDATAAMGTIVYVAVAEDTPDAVRDGPVAGAAVGVLRGGTARWAPLACASKVEGVSLDPADLRRAHVVVDADDPSRPSELMELELVGPWLSAS